LPHADGSRSGGRRAGTPNKATRELKKFLDRVFQRAFSETRTAKTIDRQGGVTEVQLSLEERLVDGIIRGSVADSELRILLQYWAGRPAQHVDHKHSGTLKLENLITGTLPPDDGDDDD